MEDLSVALEFDYYESNPITYRKIELTIPNVLKYAIELRPFYNERQEIIKLAYNRDEVTNYLRDMELFENDDYKKQMIVKLNKKINDIFDLYFMI